MLMNTNSTKRKVIVTGGREGREKRLLELLFGKEADDVVCTSKPRPKTDIDITQSLTKERQI